MYRCLDCKAGRCEDCEDDTCDCAHPLPLVERDWDEMTSVERGRDEEE